MRMTNIGHFTIRNFRASPISKMLRPPCGCRRSTAPLRSRYLKQQTFIEDSHASIVAGPIEFWGAGYRFQ